MPITKNGGRQTVLHARVDVSYADLAAGAVTTTTIFAALDLPGDAVIVSGALVVTTAFVGPTAATVSIGDGASAARYLADTDLKTAARTALVPTGFKYTAKDSVDCDVAMSVAVATAGAFTLEVDYVIDGRANENQD